MKNKNNTLDFIEGCGNPQNAIEYTQNNRGAGLLFLFI